MSTHSLNGRRDQNQQDDDTEAVTLFIQRSVLARLFSNKTNKPFLTY